MTYERRKRIIRAWMGRMNARRFAFPPRQIR